jgi:hypothetical protein
MRAYSIEEIDGIGAKISPIYQPLPAFAAATGLRPEEWQALERREIDRKAGIVNVSRTVSSGEVIDLGKTARSGSTTCARPSHPAPLQPGSPCSSSRG